MKTLAHFMAMIIVTASVMATVTVQCSAGEVHLESYDDFRNGVGFDISSFSDGQVIWFTGPGIAGPGVLRTGIVSDDGGTRIRSNVNTSRHWKRITSNVTPEMFGAVGDGITPDDVAFNKAASAGGKIIATTGANYFLSSSIAIDTDVHFDFNSASITVGPKLQNAFKLTANINRLTIENVSHVDYIGETQSAETYRNFYTAYPAPGTTGFPIAGTGFKVKKLTIENCTIGVGRVYIEGDSTTKTIFSNNEQSTSAGIVRPCHLLINGCTNPTIKNNLFEARYHEDSVKVSTLSKNLILSDNIFNSLGSNVAECDIYNGLETASIYANKFFKTQLHRKQTGSGNAIADVGHDKIMFNHFEFDYGETAPSQGLYPIYFRGSTGHICYNTIKVRTPQSYTNVNSGIHLDSENNAYDAFESEAPQSIVVAGNIIDIRDCGGNQNYGIEMATSSESILLLGNTVLGGQRFTYGGSQNLGSILVANSWRSPTSPTGSVLAEVSVANVLKDGTTRGSQGNVATNEWLHVNNTDSTPAVTGYRFIRLSAASISDFDDGYTGQELIIHARSTSTIAHDQNVINLNGGIDYVMPPRSSLHLVKTDDGWWQEIGRSSN